MRFKNSFKNYDYQQPLIRYDVKKVPFSEWNNPDYIDFIQQKK